MVALVGYTGFVGSNIYASAGNKIDSVYNSKNIKEKRVQQFCNTSRVKMCSSKGNKPSTTKQKQIGRRR